MSRLSKFIREMEKNEPPCPKWRDEKCMAKMFWFPFGLGVATFAWPNHREYCWPEVALFMIFCFMLGHLTGISSGKETEQLFPSGYKWDGETKSWIKK